MAILEFLNTNSVAFTIIFSAMVAFATLIYALLTWKLVSETRKMRQSQTEPSIAITVHSKEEWINFLDMDIQNIGPGPAYEVEFKINMDFEYEKGKYLSDLPLMKKGIKYLAPNQKLEFFLTSMAQDFEQKTKKPFEVVVIYQDSVGKDFKDTYSIDLSQFAGLSRLGEPHLYKIAKNIESIQRDINQLCEGIKRIEVVVYTKSDIEEESSQLLERAKKQAQNRAEDKQ